MDMLLKFGIGADSSTFELPHFETPRFKTGKLKTGHFKMGKLKTGLTENLGKCICSVLKKELGSLVPLKTCCSDGRL